MNCENRVDIDAFLNDVIECSNIRQNGLPTCIDRITYSKDELRKNLPTIEKYLFRLLKNFRANKLNNRTNVIKKVGKIKEGLSTIHDVLSATDIRLTRKDRIEDIYHSFTELLKIHRGLSQKQFEVTYYGYLRLGWRAIKSKAKVVIFLLITIPMATWGLLESYSGLWKSIRSVLYLQNQQDSRPKNNDSQI